MRHLLQHSIDHSADRFGDRDAFRFEGEALGYETLALRANALANLLIEQGVKRSDRVGIYMNKGLELPVAIYGILKAGAAYVPIDPSSPVERVALLIKDCGIRHLVTNQSRAARAHQLCADLEAAKSALQCVIGTKGPENSDKASTTQFFEWQSTESAPTTTPDVTLVEQDLAYIMVTSGSTGTPKGLMHTHRSGRAYAELSAEEYGVESTDRLGNHSPLHFDMSTFEYLTAPFCGATTVIIPEDVVMFPRSVAQLIEQEQLTFWYSVPLALIQLLLHGDILNRDLNSLRWILFGGEPFPQKHLARLVDLLPHARFSNSYGPAEVNQCTAYHLPRGPLDVTEPLPIGPVWSGSEGMVVGADNAIVAPGESGELLIRSPTMMQGYWARPDLNREAFFEEEQFPDFDRTFYRTGDLVRDRGDGNLLFLGRKDRQVKVRGYRVELDEVEAALGSLPGVTEAAAVCIRDTDANSTIEAAVTVEHQPNHTEAPSVIASGLRKHLQRLLPAYAVPSEIHIRATLPRTGSDKIDRRALTEELARAHSDTAIEI